MEIGGSQTYRDERFELGSSRVYVAVREIVDFLLHFKIINVNVSFVWLFVCLFSQRSESSHCFDNPRFEYDNVKTGSRSQKLARNLRKSPLFAGAGGKAFCAGGDIRSLTESVASGGTVHEEFFKEEYILDHALATLPMPYVAIIGEKIFWHKVTIIEQCTVEIIPHHSIHR